MFRQLLPVAALLTGSFFLLLAGGVNGLILPVRGSAEGFPAVALGLLGTGWAVGYVSGCVFVPRLVARVGHIRAFSVMCALGGISILLSLLIIWPLAWIVFRAIAGFAFAGAAMIVESWLAERATAASRGRIFGIYTMVNLAGITLGQLSLTLGDTSTHVFFVLGAVFYALALIPTSTTTSASPKPLASVSLDVPALWRNSPVAVFAVLMVGVSNAAFGALSPVYADRIGLGADSVALFASVPILAGALSQVPIGALSDRMDRRKVLVGIAALALLADAVFLGLGPEGRFANLGLAAIFGAAVYAMYPVIVAHANDHSKGDPIQVSGGLLMVFGVGSMVGPFVAGIAMSAGGAWGLFAVTAVAHVALISFAILRIRRRESLAPAEKGAFVAAPIGRTTTPQTAALAAAAGRLGPEAKSDSVESSREAG